MSSSAAATILSVSTSDATTTIVMVADSSLAKTATDPPRPRSRRASLAGARALLQRMNEKTINSSGSTARTSRHFQRRRSRRSLSLVDKFVDLGRALDACFADGTRGKKKSHGSSRRRSSTRRMADGEEDTSQYHHMRRDRSLWELIFATFLVAFLVGFVCVLCIGNYFRAKRAMERQRELRRRRASSATNNNGSNTTDSPRSLASESTANTDNNQNYNHNTVNNERKYLLGGGPPQQQQRGQPELPRRRAGLLSGPSPSPTEDLLLFPDRGGDGNSEKPKIMRV
jgi:hypothetical protein